MSNIDFYSNIYKYYDTIFPYQPAQGQFVKNLTNDLNTKAHILDCGCGTASLAIELARKSYTVEAFDFDEKMIKIALQKKEEHYPYKYPVLRQGDMKKLPETYPNKSFNVILCFGNTFVHLIDKEEQFNFLKSAYNLLDNKGLLSIQILNYEFILREKPANIPEIKNEKLSFERKYFYLENGLIDFTSILRLHSEKTQHTNSVLLRPITKSTLEKMLLEIGFTNIHFYGNFKMETLTEKSLPLVLSCQKP